MRFFYHIINIFWVINEKKQLFFVLLAPRRPLALATAIRLTAVGVGRDRPVVGFWSLLLWCARLLLFFGARAIRPLLGFTGIRLSGFASGRPLLWRAIVRPGIFAGRLSVPLSFRSALRWTRRFRPRRFGFWLAIGPARRPWAIGFALRRALFVSALTVIGAVLAGSARIGLAKTGQGLFFQSRGSRLGAVAHFALLFLFVLLLDIHEPRILLVLLI